MFGSGRQRYQARHPYQPQDYNPVMQQYLFTGYHIVIALVAGFVIGYVVGI